MFSKEKVDQFQLEEGQDIPKGLTADLLANLHDLIHKLGLIDQDDNLRRMWLEEPNEIYVSAPNDPSRKSMMIVGKDAAATEGSYVIRVSGPMPEMVFWDIRVPVESIKSFIETVDSIAKENGLIDPTTDERKQTYMSSDGGKMKVEVIFNKPGTAMPVLLGGPTSKELLNRFDHPELLIVSRTPLGGEVIVRIDSLGYQQHREQVVYEILREEGITPNDFATLSVERLLEVREKIKKRMAQ